LKLKDADSVKYKTIFCKNTFSQKPKLFFRALLVFNECGKAKVRYFIEKKQPLTQLFGFGPKKNCREPWKIHGRRIIFATPKRGVAQLV
jgi:hypothetical protein